MKSKPQNFSNQDVTAVIYCRISSKKQEREGDGLASQETRLRDYCLRMGYNVETVFRDKLTGSESQRLVCVRCSLSSARTRARATA